MWSRRRRSTLHSRLDLAALSSAAPAALGSLREQSEQPDGDLDGAPDHHRLRRRVLAEAPDAAILIDEASHEYATDPVTPPRSRSRSRCGRFRLAHVLEGVRHGRGHAHRLRRSAPLDTIQQLMCSKTRNLVNVPASRRPSPCSPIGSPSTRSARATPTPRAFTVSRSTPGHKPSSLAGELPVRRHRPATEGLPGGLPEARRPRRPPLPAVRAVTRAYSLGRPRRRRRRRPPCFATCSSRHVNG